MFENLANEWYKKHLGITLNEPDRVVKFNKDGKSYISKFWELPEGSITRTSIDHNLKGDTVNSKMDISPIDESLLNEALDIAVEEERYEDAAKIRDYLKK
jgi:hypothetical protein